MTQPPDRRAINDYLSALTEAELQAVLADARGTGDHDEIDALAVLGFKHRETEDN